MIRVFCDRCNKITGMNPPHFELEGLDVVNAGQSLSETKMYFQLCNECYDDLKGIVNQWLKEQNQQIINRVDK